MNALFFFQNTQNRQIIKYENANLRNVSVVVDRIGNGKG